MDLSVRVHAFVRTVPRGRVTTYGDVAWAVGCPGASRAVGRIMAMAPDGSSTPCHRVVRSDGRVAAGKDGRTLAARLRREGVAVSPAGSIRDFAALRWPQDAEPMPVQAGR